MKSSRCPSCGAKMKERRKTSAGRQRWRCPSRRASSTVRRDRERHRVPCVDGIRLARDLVALICRSDGRAVSWYMARSETSRARSAPMDPIPAPDAVVSDGGPGFAGAVRRSWPGTRVQRCVFHAFCQVRRYTTPGRGRALRARGGPAAYRDPAPGGAPGRALPAAVRLLGGLPRGRLRGRRQAGARARAAPQGPLVAVEARLRGDAVHLPGSGADRGGADPECEQRSGEPETPACATCSGTAAGCRSCAG